MKYQNGEEFLNYLNKNMHLEDIVMHTAKKSDTPVEKISKYMSRLEKTHNMAKNNKHKMDVLKQLYYDKYVISELPESYIYFQQKIARERGYGNIDITEIKKDEMLSRVQKEQKHSLDSWVEYFCSDEAMYPMWFKNYAFTGMLKLGKFDKKTETFGKRTKTTVEPYLELNKEVLAQVYSTLIHQLGKYELSELEEQSLINGESFKKLYTYYLRNNYNTKKNSEKTDGVWVKYDQGSDYHLLCESLQGKNTGWCTAGVEDARNSLLMGDFYVYYTKDEQNEYKNPRLAIKMIGKDEIYEVRGIAEGQNIEPVMEEIVDKKLDEFSDKKKYQKKMHDMKKLTVIENKQNENEMLSLEELRFLYEIDSTIDGFGGFPDPRIQQIRQSRNERNDLSIIFDMQEDEIGINISDFETSDKIKFYYGDLEWSGLTVPKCFENLREIRGTASFPNLVSAENLKSLEIIHGEAEFGSLQNAAGLKSLKQVGGTAYFTSLTSAKGLERLEIVEHAHFDSLISAEGLESLKEVKGLASFPSLISAIGLERLEKIGLDADFSSLVTAKGLESLREIGIANFSSLINSEGLRSLERIEDGAYFPNLKNAEGLENLKIIDGIYTDFSSLISAKGLESLEIIGGEAHFESLVIAKGLKSLREISASAYFNNLTNTEGLESLEKIGGDAFFYNLATKEDSHLSQITNGQVYFSNQFNSSFSKTDWPDFEAFNELPYENQTTAEVNNIHY